MSTSESSLGRNPGLANVVDIVMAPGAAFERLRAVPTWGWAFLVGTVLAVIGTVLTIPAISHALEVTMPAQLAANPAIAKLPPEQQQAQIAQFIGISKTFVRFSWLFAPIAILLAGLLQGLVMMIANAIARGDGTFKRYFALSVNVAVVGYGLNAVVTGLIATVKGASAYQDTASIQGSLPSLALLVPGAHGFVAGFLGAINVFYLWASALLALGMVRIGRVSPPVAWGAAVVMLLLTACFAGWGAARNG